ncbi:MAG: hypothetical protein Q8Q73_07885 [Stagnimonas sp.]|nr:hypothetical protein [Stagnimonas sp.]
MKTSIRGLRGVLYGAGVVVLLQGCTTLYEGKYDYRDGWRKARVVQVAPASQIQRPDFFRCIRNATPEQRERQLFAVVTFRGYEKSVKRAVQVAPSVHIEVGETVYVNPSSCDGPVIHASVPAARIR